MTKNRRGWRVLGTALGLLLFLPALGACANGVDPTRPTAGRGDGQVIASLGPVKLQSTPIRVALQGAEETPLGAVLDTLGRNRRLYLVLRDLRTDEQPGVLYDVYLDLPAGGQPRENDPHYVGSFNFYNAAGTAGSFAPSNARFQSFDISGVARALRARGKLSDRTTITVFAGGAPADAARPVIGRIELVVQ
jgi:hypothetical protein